MFFLFLRWLLTTHCCPLKVGWLPPVSSSKPAACITPAKARTWCHTLPKFHIEAEKWHPGSLEIPTLETIIFRFHVFSLRSVLCFARQVIPIRYFAITCISTFMIIKRGCWRFIDFESWLLSLMVIHDQWWSSMNLDCYPWLVAMKIVDDCYQP